MVENKDPMAKAIDTLKPILTKLTFGSLMGYCSGYATKRIGKAAAFAVGVSFMVMQGLVSTGYINIDWGKVKDDAIKSVDTDGDGTLGTNDLKEYWSRFKKIMLNKMPDAGGFSLGFLYGVRYG